MGRLLRLHPATFRIGRLVRHHPLDRSAFSEPHFVVSVPGDDSLIASVGDWPESLAADSTSWRMLVLEGPFDFEQSGILAPLLVALAEAGVPVLVQSGLLTDYVFVRSEQLEVAVQALAAIGATVQ